MKKPTKNCIVCGNEYIKPLNCSLKDWENRKYCSKRCINVGRTPPNRRDDFNTNCLNCNLPFRKRVAIDKYCSRKCARARQVVSKESILQGALKRSGENNSSKRPEVREKLKQMFSGSKSHFWKGGISKENYRLRRTAAYKNWRTSVFTRDNHICQDCGIRGGNLQAHHIKPWNEYPELRFQLDNGKTLCIDCHKQTESFAKNLR